MKYRITVKYVDRVEEAGNWEEMDAFGIISFLCRRFRDDQILEYLKVERVEG